MAGSEMIRTGGLLSVLRKAYCSGCSSSGPVLKITGTQVQIVKYHELHITAIKHMNEVEISGNVSCI